MESKWSGTIEDAFFNGEAFDRNRKLQQPEKEASGRSGGTSYYVVSADIGRRGCDSVATIIKVIPSSGGQQSTKSIVNIYTKSDEHFEAQALWLKKLYYAYRAKRLVIDANGLGLGLVDYLIKPQIDELTNDYYPPFGVYNDPDNYYKKFITDDTEQEAMFLVKAQAAITTEVYTNLQTQLNSGRIKFLIDERIAKMKLLATKMGQAMRPEERQEYLLPFTLTSILREELLNLHEETEGVNINLKQTNRRIKKDKVSSLGYGLYYIKQEEESKRKKKKFKISDLMFFS